jgi:hypothetical protein
LSDIDREGILTEEISKDLDRAFSDFNDGWVEKKGSSS